MRTIVYLCIPELLRPLDPQEPERLQAAGANEVYVDWGARHTTNLIEITLLNGVFNARLVSSVSSISSPKPSREAKYCWIQAICLSRSVVRWFAFHPGGTSMIRVVFVPLVISQDPENPIYYTRLDPGYIGSWPFNNDLNPYPWIFPLGFRGNVGDDPETNAYVPFPAPPFANCEPALRDQFDPNCPYRPMPLDLFQCRVRHYYDDQNWLDQQGYQTHHIKPVACGGASDSSNGVLLPDPEEHDPFTDWWKNFDKSICKA